MKKKYLSLLTLCASMACFVNLTACDGTDESKPEQVATQETAAPEATTVSDASAEDQGESATQEAVAVLADAELPSPSTDETVHILPYPGPTVA